jgi:lysozyme
MKRIFNIVLILIFLFFLSYVPKIYGQQKTTAVGISMIKQFETLYLHTYLCPSKILTVGYGHTGRDVYPGMLISEKQGELLLRNDLNRFENYVDETIERTMRWHEFDALVSFTFNVGHVSDELKYALEVGNTKIVIMKIMQYNKGTVNKRKIVLSGLIRRRKAECALYDNTYLKVWSKLLLSM